MPPRRLIRTAALRRVTHTPLKAIRMARSKVDMGEMEAVMIRTGMVGGGIELCCLGQATQCVSKIEPLHGTQRSYSESRD